jgi:hypothetical protein
MIAMIACALSNRNGTAQEAQIIPFHELTFLTKVYPLGREAQALEPWEERPRLSGFSPQRLCRFLLPKTLFYGTLVLVHARSRFAGGKGSTYIKN